MQVELPAIGDSKPVVRKSWLPYACCGSATKGLSSASCDLISMSTQEEAVYARILCTQKKGALLHLVSHPAYAIKAIEAHTDEAQTRKTYTSSILACFKHLPQLKDTYPKEFDRWLAFERTEGAKITEQYRSNQPTALQAAKAVDWRTVQNLPHQMPRGSYELLMLALYRLVTPSRVDFSPCQVVRSEAERAECERDGINCIKLDGKNPEMCIAHHKTRASHGTIRKNIPQELCQEIEDSLNAFPRSWLFAAADDGDKP